MTKVQEPQANEERPKRQARYEMVTNFLRFARLCHDRAAELKSHAYIAHDAPAIAAGCIVAKATGGRIYHDIVEIPSFADPNWYASDSAFFEHTVESYLRSADGILTIGWALANELRGYGRPITVIPNYRCAEELSRSDELRQTCGLNVRDVLLLATSTIYSGFEPIIEALNLLPDNVHLATLGDVVSDYAPRLYAHPVNCGVEHRVHFFDEVPYSRLPTVASGANIALIARDPTIYNHYISLPNRVFDNIAAGLPVVTLDLPDIARVVRERRIGTVAPRNEADCWAEAIKLALDGEHEIRPRVRKASRELAWENIEKDLHTACGSPDSVAIIGYKNLIGHQRTVRMANSLVKLGVKVTICCPKWKDDVPDPMPGVRYVFTANPFIPDARTGTSLTFALEQELEVLRNSANLLRYKAQRYDTVFQPEMAELRTKIAKNGAPKTQEPSRTTLVRVDGEVLQPGELMKTFLVNSQLPTELRHDLLEKLEKAYANQKRLRLHKIWDVKLNTTKDRQPDAPILFRGVFEEMLANYWVGPVGAKPAKAEMIGQLRELLSKHELESEAWQALVTDLERNPELARHFEILSLAELALLNAFLPQEERPLRILEVGGGFGRLGHVFLSTSRPVIYVNIDLVPHSLAMSYQFLTQNHGDISVVLSRTDSAAARFFSRAERGQSCALILPAWLAETVPSDYFDVLINIASFQEMEEDSIAAYIALFDRAGRDGAVAMVSNSRDYPYAKEITYPGNWRLRYKDFSLRSFMGDYPLEFLRIGREKLHPSANKELEDRYNQSLAHRYRKEVAKWHELAVHRKEETAQLRAEYEELRKELGGIPDLPKLRWKAQQWDALMIPELLRKAERYDTLEKEVVALREVAAQHAALQQILSRDRTAGGDQPPADVSAPAS